MEREKMISNDKDWLIQQIADPGTGGTHGREAARARLDALRPCSSADRAAAADSPIHPDPLLRSRLSARAGGLFVADTPEQAQALAKAAHPEDDGCFMRYIPREKLARIYAHRR